jgi:hypothetical protein
VCQINIISSRTETELKIRNEIERKMQDNQPNVEKEKWLYVWGFEHTESHFSFSTFG